MHKPPICHKLMFCRIARKEFEIRIFAKFQLRLQCRCVLTILLHTLGQFLVHVHKHSVETRLLFYHGTAAVAIAMALTIDKKADVVKRHGGLHGNNLASTTWQGVTNNSSIASFNI